MNGGLVLLAFSGNDLTGNEWFSSRIMKSEREVKFNNLTSH